MRPIRVLVAAVVLVGAGAWHNRPELSLNSGGPGRAVLPTATMPSLASRVGEQGITTHSRPVSPAATQDIPPLSRFVELIRGYDAATVRRTFPAYNQGLFATLFGPGPGIPLTTDEETSLFSQQLVVTPAEFVIDIGHVITGIEAGGNLPIAARLAQQQTGCQLVAAVTWSGDVGAALYAYLAEGRIADPGVYLQREAPVEDLLGDLDGWLLGRSGPVGVDAGALLEREYGNPTFEATRFQRFVRALSASSDSSSPPVADAARDAVTREVTCFARALAMFSGSGVDAATIVAGAPPFVDGLLAFLRNGLSRELPQPQPGGQDE